MTTQNTQSYRYAIGRYEEATFRVAQIEDSALEGASAAMDAHGLNGERVIAEGYGKLFDPSLVAGDGEPEISRVLHDAIEANPTYKRLAAACKHRTTLSASVAATLFPRAIAGLPEPDEQGQEPGQDPGQDPGNGGGGLSPAQESALRRAVRAAVVDAEQQVDDFEAGQRIFGETWGDETGSITPSEWTPGVADPFLNDKQLQEILRLAGNLVPIAEQKAAKTRREGIGALVGAKKGRSADALPHEFAKLSSPALSGLFYARYAGRTLDIWKRESKGDQGLGPIIVCLDQSGSMNKQARDTFAKAITLVMGAQARLEGREFAVIAYDKVVRSVVRGCRPSDLLKSVTCSPDGGTHFGPALLQAQKLLAEKDFVKADILLITDGVAKARPDLRAQLEAEGVNIVGLAVGDVSGVDALQDTCHSVYGLADLTTQKAKGVVEQI